MQYFQQSIKELANRVARFPFLKSILKPFYYYYKKILSKKRNKIFRANALNVLYSFHEALEKKDLYYTLAFGTLLGAIREQGFIKHDLDIDLAMWADDYYDGFHDYMLESGFKLAHSFEIDEGLLGREDTFIKNGVYIDVFYFYPPYDKLPYCCDFLGREGCVTYRQCMSQFGGALPRRISLPINRDRKLSLFEGHLLYVPINAEEILSMRYGPDYMIPNPSWGIKSYDNNIVEWPEKLGVYKDFE